MYTGFGSECDSASRCSTASPAGETLTYYPSPDGSYSSLGSPATQCQEFTDLAVSSASFIPTVTAISTSADLQWLIQPTNLISSVAPSYTSASSYGAQRSTPTLSTAGLPKISGTKGSNSRKRGNGEQLSPEEEEKKRLRRERNKMAAAKCRNRRRELTDSLQSETDLLENAKSALKTEIANLMKEKEKLEFILMAHRPACKMPSNLEPAETSLSPAHSISSELSSSKLEAPASPKPSTFSAYSALEVNQNSTVKLSDLDNSLEESLDLLTPLRKITVDTVRSVPDMDLSGSFCTQDWEPLYTTNNLEPLSTPVVTCTPTCTTYSSSFVFTYSDADALPNCGVAHRRESSSNDQSSDSLSSPTLLAL